jgi:hypothetical protein
MTFFTILLRYCIKFWQVLCKSQFPHASCCYVLQIVHGTLGCFCTVFGLWKSRFCCIIIPLFLVLDKVVALWLLCFGLG